jgi:hypothetical protein
VTDELAFHEHRRTSAIWFPIRKIPFRCDHTQRAVDIFTAEGLEVCILVCVVGRTRVWTGRSRAFQHVLSPTSLASTFSGTSNCMASPAKFEAPTRVLAKLTRVESLAAPSLASYCRCFYILPSRRVGIAAMFGRDATNQLLTRLGRVFSCSLERDERLRILLRVCRSRVPLPSLEDLAFLRPLFEELVISLYVRKSAIFYISISK